MAAYSTRKFHLFPNGIARRGLFYFAELIKHQEAKEIRWARCCAKIKAAPRIFNRLPRVFFLFHYISALDAVFSPPWRLNTSYFYLKDAGPLFFQPFRYESLLAGGRKRAL